MKDAHAVLKNKQMWKKKTSFRTFWLESSYIHCSGYKRPLNAVNVNVNKQTEAKKVVFRPHFYLWSGRFVLKRRRRWGRERERRRETLGVQAPIMTLKKTNKQRKRWSTRRAKGKKHGGIIWTQRSSNGTLHVTRRCSVPPWRPGACSFDATAALHRCDNQRKAVGVDWTLDL